MYTVSVLYTAQIHTEKWSYLPCVVPPRSRDPEPAGICRGICSDKATAHRPMKVPCLASTVLHLHQAFAWQWMSQIHWDRMGQEDMRCTKRWSRIDDKFNLLIVLIVSRCFKIFECHHLFEPAQLSSHFWTCPAIQSFVVVLSAWPTRCPRSLQFAAALSEVPPPDCNLLAAWVIWGCSRRTTSPYPTRMHWILHWRKLSRTVAKRPSPVMTDGCYQPLSLLMTAWAKCFWKSVICHCSLVLGLHHEEGSLHLDFQVKTRLVSKALSWFRDSSMLEAWAGYNEATSDIISWLSWLLLLRPVFSSNNVVTWKNNHSMSSKTIQTHCDFNSKYI